MTIYYLFLKFLTIAFENHKTNGQLFTGLVHLEWLDSKICTVYGIILLFTKYVFTSSSNFSASPVVTYDEQNHFHFNTLYLDDMQCQISSERS